jgi:hypothetical protein
MLKNMRHKHEYRGNTSKGLNFLPQEVRNSIFGIEMGMSLYVIQVITPRYIQIYNKDKHRNRHEKKNKFECDFLLFLDLSRLYISTS